MAPEGYYRYISHPAEVDQVMRERKIQTTNPRVQGTTWYTPTRYDDPLQAQRELALKHVPSHRIGPIPAAMMPPFDIQPRLVDPAFSQAGGGIEVRTKEAVWLSGVWSFTNNQWEL